MYPSSSSFVLCIKRNLTLTQKKNLYFFLFFHLFFFKKNENILNSSFEGVLERRIKYTRFWLAVVSCVSIVYTHFMSANDKSKRLDLFVFHLVWGEELGTKGEVMMVLVVWSYSLPIYDDLRRSDECFQRTRRELRGDGWLDFTSCGSCYYVFSWLLMWSQVLPCFVLAPFKSITWVLCVCV